MESIPYKDIIGLRQLLDNLQSAHEALRQSTMQDASNGYPAVIHQSPADLMSLDELENHPWYQSDLLSDKDFPMHDKALQGVTAIWFDNRSDPRCTLDFPGLVACSEFTLQQVDAVNHSKSEFKARVLEIKHRYQELTDHDIEKELVFREGEWAAVENVRRAFAQAGLARICVKQVYRPIPKIDSFGLMRAQYYRKAKRPVRPTTVALQLDKFTQKAKKHPTAELLEAIKILAQMPPHQNIAEIQNANRIITVNCKMLVSEQDNISQWHQVTGVLPVFYLSNSKSLLPSIDFSALDKREQKIVERSQHKWANEPFLPAFRLYLSNVC